jgi:uncharacterized phage protein (TIGR01671 family)
MSREIKFRAWNKRNQNWLNSEIMIDCDGLVYDCDSHYLSELDQSEIELVQFTGLLDRNGKEIFENDIIKIIMTNCRTLKFEIFIDLVYWSKTDAMFCLKKLSRNMLTLQTQNVEIIGNVYQNPELLGGEND